MSPVPDPSQNHQSNPVDEINLENYGPGFIGHGSSSEEEDPSGNEMNEYQPLPQGPENLDDELTDYSSLSGLLSALNTHGPNEINEANSDPPDSDCEENRSITNDIRRNPHENLETGSSRQEISESEKQASNEFRKEQSLLWNSRSGSNQFEIDEDKKEVIKLAMSKIILPNSAIPTWAKELSEEDWKHQVHSRLFGKENVTENQT